MEFKVEYKEDKNLVIKPKIERKGNDVVIHLPGPLNVLTELNRLKKEGKIKIKDKQ